MDGQVSLFGPDLECGRTCLAATPAEDRQGPTFRPFSKRSFKLKNQTFMLLDLRPGAGNMLGPCWEYDPPWLGPPGTLNTSACPSGGAECSLSLILQDIVPSKYYLSRTACLGILRRARERGKELPERLETALKMQAGIAPLSVLNLEPTAFAANQRDEVRDLHGVAGALGAQSGMKQQTFIAAFNAGAGPSASTIGYQEEVAPTLKGAPSGNMMPAVLCLNDQGGSVMDCSEDVSGTLRAQEHGHQPLVLYEAHGKDARYKGPLQVAPTVVTAYGTGGNNLPLVGKKLFSRQRVDKFQSSEVASTESARQHKDATDLVCQPAGTPLLIRRLTPLECERLQGYDDGFTDLPGASDSARYRALGNSVCIPCVVYIMRGLALAAE